MPKKRLVLPGIRPHLIQLGVDAESDLGRIACLNPTTEIRFFLRPHVRFGTTELDSLAVVALLTPCPFVFSSAVRSLPQV